MTTAIEKNNDAIEQTATPVRIQRVTPAVDVYENENEMVFVADMPGVSQKSLDIQIEKRELSFSGDVEKGYRYERAFRLPDSLDSEGASASLKNGVLTITCKKAESAKPKKIQVKLQ